MSNPTNGYWDSRMASDETVLLDPANIFKYNGGKNLFLASEKSTDFVFMYL